MFLFSSFPLGTLLYVLGVSVYQASMPSTDVSRGWEAPVPAVVFDCRVAGITNKDINLLDCNAITPGIIDGLPEPIVFVDTGLDSQTDVSEGGIMVDDIPSRGIVGEVLDGPVEMVSAAAVVQTPAATTPIDDASSSPASVPEPSMQVSLRVGRAQSNLRTFKSLALSVFTILAVTSLVMVLKHASWTFSHRSLQSILTSRPSLSSFLRSSAQVSVFTMMIIIFTSFTMGFLVRNVSFEKLFHVMDKLHPLFIDLCSCFGTMASCAMGSAVSDIVDSGPGGVIGQGEAIIEYFSSLEHGGNIEASVDKASLPSGSVCDEAVEPLRISVNIRPMAEVAPEGSEVSTSSPRFDRSTSTDIVRLVGRCHPTDPVSTVSIRIPAQEESEEIFVPSESRSTLYATATEGNVQSEITDSLDVFSVPTVSSDYNLYTTAETLSFPSVDDLGNITGFQRLGQDVRALGDPSEADNDEGMHPTLPATELGVSPSMTSAPPSPRPVRPLPLEYFCDRWGADTKHLWSREFWYRVLKSEELIKVVYETMFPPEEGASDEHQYQMELGEGHVRMSAWRLSEHATNPIQCLPYNVLPEDVSNKDLFVSTEVSEIAASSAASTGTRPSSPFVRPSNPQSRELESSSEGSVSAPSIDSPSSSAADRTSSASAQVMNTPRATMVPRSPVKDSFVSTEASVTAVSSAASSRTRSSSPFKRPSNPQSRELESSSEGSVSARSTVSPARTPAVNRMRPVLGQLTNVPRAATLPRTPIKVRHGKGAQNAVLTPPPSLRPKLVKRTGRFPVVAPARHHQEESGPSTSPARVAPSASNFPRWRG